MEILYGRSRSRQKRRHTILSAHNTLSLKGIVQRKEEWEGASGRDGNGG